MEPDSRDFIFLADVSHVLCKFLEPLFITNNIPIIKHFKGSGQYLEVVMGYSITGVQIYVPKRLYNQALELLEYLESGTDFEMDQE